MTLLEWIKAHEVSCSLEDDFSYWIRERFPSWFHDLALGAEELHQLNTAHAAWKQGMPIGYLLGTQPFGELNLTCDGRALIPRSDTESWVMFFLEQAPRHACRLLDLGTGSGAIALQIKKSRPNWDVFGVDLHEDALSLARENAKKHQLDVSWQQWDFHAPPATAYSQTWDYILSNPPYLSEQEWQARPALHVEPRSALIDRDGHGLSAFTAIADYATQTLKPLGELWLEHGWTQRASLRDVLAAYPFGIRLCYDDLGNRERVVVCQKKA